MTVCVHQAIITMHLYFHFLSNCVGVTWRRRRAVHVWEKRWRGRAKRRIRLTAHVFAACQPLLRGDLIGSVRIQAHNYFAKYWTVRTINPEDLADQSESGSSSACLSAHWPPLSCINKRRCAPLCFSVSHSVTDEYKMKGVEKVKYISGEEGGVDGQDSTVCDSIVFFVFYLFLYLMLISVCMQTKPWHKLYIQTRDQICAVQHTFAYQWWKTGKSLTQ